MLQIKCKSVSVDIFYILLQYHSTCNVLISIIFRNCMSTYMAFDSNVLLIVMIKQHFKIVFDACASMHLRKLKKTRHSTLCRPTVYHARPVYFLSIPIHHCFGSTQASISDWVLKISSYWLIVSMTTYLVSYLMVVGFLFFSWLFN